MNRDTGAALDELAHIRQSIADILGTRLGTRVMRREYGSLLLDLVDQPFNATTRIRVYAATAMALMRWEPRISLNRVQFAGATLHGQIVLDMDLVVVDSNTLRSLSVPLKLGAAT